MSLPVMPNPKVQFFDSNGNPLSGGKVYTYDANASTPKATYTSADGTMTNTNPVILDSRGEASIYLSGSYKIILKDSNDVQIWSEPDISIMPYQVITQSEWIAQNLIFTYSSATVFTTAGDHTSIFQVGRRIKATVSAGTVYGVIKTSAYTTLTTVTVVLDSGSLDSGLSAVWVGLLTVTNPAFPGLYIIPRYTTTQRDALTAANGMFIYNTTTSRYQWYNGSWLDVVDTNSVDTLAGKTLTNPKILTGGSIQNGGGAKFLEVVEVATPVNYMRLENANTGLGPKFSAQGTDANIDLQLEAKGTGVVKPSRLFGAWDATKANNTVYQAATDGFIMGWVSTGGYNGSTFIGNIYSDGTNPPTTVRASAAGIQEGSAGHTLFVIAPIRKGDYYKIVLTGSGAVVGSIFWMPLG